MSLRASTIRINARQDYKISFGGAGGAATRLRDLIDVDSESADEPGEDKRFLVYDHGTNSFVFSNRLDGNTSGVIDRNGTTDGFYDF